MKRWVASYILQARAGAILTNNCTAETVLQNVPRNAKFLYSAMEQFPPEKTMEFFASQGLKLKTERGNRVFPCSDKAADVIDTLFFALKRGGCTLSMAGCAI